MTKLRIFLIPILLAVFTAACAPESVPMNPPPPETLSPVPLTPKPTEATVLPVATSRGSDLHATDPTTVSLASGGLQFVEFFRFT